MNKVSPFLSGLLRQRFIRYLIVGGFSFIIDFGLLFLYRIKLHTGLTLATSIGYWSAVIFNFTLNRYWSFSTKDIKNLHKHALFYGVLLAFNYTFTVIFIKIFTDALSNVSPTKALAISKVLIVGIQTTWNFFVYKKYIFKETDLKNSSGLGDK